MELIEFYKTPEGDVMYKPLGKPVQELTVNSREIVEEMLDLIKTRYPHAFKALCELYTASELNRKVYEFNIVSRFCRCNFGEYDAHTPDIDADGFSTSRKLVVHSEVSAEWKELSVSLNWNPS